MGGGGCVYVFLILHCIPATLKLVFPLPLPPSFHFYISPVFFSLPLWLWPSLNCCPIFGPRIVRELPRIKTPRRWRVSPSPVGMSLFFFVVVVVVVLGEAVGGWGDRGHIMPPLRARGRDSPGFVRFDSPK